MNESNFAGEKEFAINYYEGSFASLTSSITKFTNKAKKLAKQYPDKVFFYENQDGSVYMQFPSDWIKFPSPKKTMSEENKIKAAERMKNARERKKNE